VNGVQSERTRKTLIKAVGSVLIAVVASSHHWLHTLLIAFGLTSLGAGLFSLSPFVKIIFLLISFVISLWFIRIAKRKWRRDRASAWVYLISSIISIALVVTSLPQLSVSLNQPNQQQQDQHQQHHTFNQ